eukprot:m.78514 g.78514  ORF g.78514 m.78514 type:complete len:350 (-) comp25121_c1_seq2:263-1312(-)
MLGTDRRHQQQSIVETSATASPPAESIIPVQGINMKIPSQSTQSQLNHVILIKVTPFDSEYLLIKSRPLGVGLCGVVFTAIHQNTQQERAVKYLLDSPEARNEAACQIIASREFKSSSRHVVKVVDVFTETMCRDDDLEEKDWLILVMELVSEGELYTRLLQQPKRRFIEDDVKVVALQMATLLSEMHASGMTHGDIKLENVLLSNANSLHDLKLTDFGFATTQQPSGTNCTVAYAAPELVRAIIGFQFTGKDMPHTNGTDMWALGVMLYLCVAGRMPFIDRRRKAGQEWVLSPNLRHAITNGKFAMTGEVWTSVSEACKAAIRSMLAVDPRQRVTAAKLLQHAWLKKL